MSDQAESVRLTDQLGGEIKCGNCKYFGEPILVDIWDEDSDKCQYEVPSGFHKCARIKHCKYESEFMDMRAEKAVAVDGSGYFAALRVQDMFGCAAFERRDT